jgi:formiminoglutamase
MDVFNASIAPGVSASAYNGIFADATFMHFYRHILKSEKLVALDVAEVNPSLIFRTERQDWQHVW